MYITNNKLIKYIKGDDVVITTKFWCELSSRQIMRKNSAILDVGCGDGEFLNILKHGGHKDLTGVDLFIDDENMKKDVKIYQSSLEEFNPKRKYDLIISNHSFEHMDNQLKNLKCFEKLVNKDGIIIIRIPIKTDYIWEKYGVNWFQLDAPRHFFLHTLKSFEILCNKTNLIIEDIIFDSTWNVLFYSEKYSQDISMQDEKWKTYEINEKTIEKYKKEIKQLNENKQADQAIFILKLNNKKLV